MPSSVIRQFRYNETKRQLAVTFVSGRRYIYADVPPEIYRQMRSSFSKGEYFNSHIRDRFAYEAADT